MKEENIVSETPWTILYSIIITFTVKWSYYAAVTAYFLPMC